MNIYKNYSRKKEINHYVTFFIWLNILDIVTTVGGMNIGEIEKNALFHRLFLFSKPLGLILKCILVGGAILMFYYLNNKYTENKRRILRIAVIAIDLLFTYIFWNNFIPQLLYWFIP